MENKKSDLQNNNQTNITLQRNKKLVLTGAFSALVVVLGLTKLGLIPLGVTASITILQIPVIIIVMMAGLWEGLFVGFVFGLISLIQSAISPSAALDPLFLNPLCSILPRLLFTVVTWAIWKLLNKSPHVPKILNAAISSFLGTISHTLLVVACIYIFEGTEVKNATDGYGFLALIASLSFNAILEAVASTIIGTSIYASVFVSSRKKSKLLSNNKV